MSIIASATTTLTPADVYLISFGFLQDPVFATGINFRTLGLGLAGVSFGLIGILMAGSAFFGEQAEHAKRTWLPTTIQGLILIGITTFIMTVLSTGIT